MTDCTQYPRALRAFIFCLMVFLASCATQPEKMPEKLADVGALKQWHIEGKLGFRSPAKNGSAWLRWKQQGSAYDLQLNGPFGAAATTIRGDDNHAVLSQSGREDFFAKHGEALSSELFGWPFPVTEMPFWVKGLPAPVATAVTTYNESNLLTSLQQQGWTLEFSNYEAFGRWTLPTRIKGSKQDYGFTLVIKDWNTDIGLTDQQ